MNDTETLNNATNIKLLFQDLGYIKEQLKESKEGQDRLEKKVDNNFASKERVTNIELRLANAEASMQKANENLAGKVDDLAKVVGSVNVKIYAMSGAGTVAGGIIGFILGKLFGA